MSAFLRLDSLRRIGPRLLFYYAVHRLRLASGWYERRTPCRSWAALPPRTLEGARSPFRRRDVAPAPASIARAERIVSGELLYFSAHWLKKPVDWTAFPGGAKTAPVHWSRALAGIDGDVKWIWEPSRFDWMTTLALASIASGDSRYEAALWPMLDDWRSQNPPNRGVNWNCAQECSIRLFALLLVAGAIEPRPVVWETVAALAERIEVSTIYSAAQNNNHLLAEATALYVSGMCLPNHPRAPRWARAGRRLFYDGILRQFASDGSYILHSTNYTREALRNACVFLQTARAFGEAVPEPILSRLRAAARLLYEMQDETSGGVPNYGHNDGSNYLDSSAGAYSDFRPIIEAISSQSGLQPPLGVRSPRFSASDGGYYVIREQESFGFIRCHTYTSRPGQADMLHFDFWRRGINLLCDSGTFEYGERGRAFESTAAHNTVTVNEHDQMTKVGRFLWGSWTKARLLRFDDRSWSGEHYGYAGDGVIHRRTIDVENGSWRITDELIGDRPFSARLRWHLHAQGEWVGVPGGVYSRAAEIGVYIDGEFTLSETKVSPTYGLLIPAQVIDSVQSGERLVRWVTTIRA